MLFRSIPVAYGQDVAQRIRAAAPDGRVDAFIDAFGGDYVRSVLGVAPGPGGAHARMGTHNLLLRLGESVFLEVIAPDPAAAPPGRPRWFGLDDVAAPRLVAKRALVDALSERNLELNDAAVELYVSRLRKKLEGTGTGIRTLRGVGYQLAISAPPPGARRKLASARP